MTDFASKLWHKSHELKERLPRDYPDKDITEEELLDILVPIVATHMSMEYIDNRMHFMDMLFENVSGKHGAETDDFKAKPKASAVARVIGGLVSNLSRMRSGSFEEVDRFISGSAPGMIVVFDDRKSPPEARYHSWVPGDLKDRLGFKGGQGA